ncbi:hypothetical protein MSIMFI_00131 [Mycobacterium simulans]|nr:hypothetical protein MSIMFI_00131 [Mycobacterium simulans]
MIGCVVGGFADVGVQQQRGDGDGRGQRHGRGGVGDQQLRGRLGQHVGAALAGVIRINRQIRRPRLTNRQQRGHQLHPTRQSHRDDGLRARPIGPQPASQPVRARRQLGIGQPVLAVDHRGGVRSGGDLRGEQLRNRRRRCCGQRGLRAPHRFPSADGITNPCCSSIGNTPLNVTKSNTRICPPPLCADWPCSTPILDILAIPPSAAVPVDHPRRSTPALR